MSNKELYSKRDIEDVMDNFGFSRGISEVALYSRHKFAEPFKLLSQYDNISVELPYRSSLSDAEEFGEFTPELAYKLVDFVKQEFPENQDFGCELDKGKFAGIIASLYCGVNGEELYPTPMAKAAHLLYFVVKDHFFIIGNKRIAVFLFCTFLEMYVPGLIGKTTGYIAMPALASLIAVSDSRDKELIVSLVMRLFQLPE